MPYHIFGADVADKNPQRHLRYVFFSQDSLLTCCYHLSIFNDQRYKKTIWMFYMHCYLKTRPAAIHGICSVPSPLRCCCTKSPTLAAPSRTAKMEASGTYQLQLVTTKPFTRIISLGSDLGHMVGASASNSQKTYGHPLNIYLAISSLVPLKRNCLKATQTLALDFLPKVHLLFWSSIGWDVVLKVSIV